MTIYFRFLVILFLILVSCNDSEPLFLKDSDENLKLKNGILQYNHKPFDGVIISQYSNENQKSKTYYRHGKKHGLEQQWYNDGSLATERHYTNGLKSAVHKGWWENGNQKFVYHFNEKGAFDGRVKEWYYDGQTYMDFNYRNGQEFGSQRLFKIDGTIKSNYEVVNGDRFGLIGLKTCYTVTNNSDALK